MPPRILFERCNVNAAGRQVRRKESATRAKAPYGIAISRALSVLLYTAFTRANRY